MVVRPGSYGLAGLAAAWLLLFDPAVILGRAGVQGQVDSARTLTFLGALLGERRRAVGVARALAMLATFKPPVRLVALPVVAVQPSAARRDGDLASSVAPSAGSP